MSREYLVVFEPDDGGWTASVPDLPGCLSDGDTFEQAQKLIAEAIQLWLETASQNGWPIPEPQAQAQKIAV